MKNKALNKDDASKELSAQGNAKKFRDMNSQERLDYLRNVARLPYNSITKLASWHDDKGPMGENHITHAPMSVDIVPCITVNGKDWVVPLITEEPSVVAAAALLKHHLC